MSNPRILVFDIETAPIRAHVWGLFKQNVGINMIDKDWAVLSFAAKWLGEDTVFYADNRFRGDPRDDKATLHYAYRLLSQADIVVAHNGQKFDMRKLRARFLHQGFPPLPPLRIHDTLLTVRREFAFTSNRLEYLTKVLTEEKKSSHGKYAGFELWRALLDNVPDAWDECEAYNKQDVVSLEELYLLLRPWDSRAPQLGGYHQGEAEGTHRCPKCGGSHVQKRGTYHTGVGVYQRFRCNDCGGWSRGAVLLNTAIDRKNILRGTV